LLKQLNIEEKSEDFDEERNQDDIILARVENIFDMRNGFDVFQMLQWGGKKNEE
jgi:hypothetical protein